MQENPQDDLPIQNEIDVLKARADKIGITYHPSIGVDKLREKLNAALAPEEPEEVQEKPSSVTETVQQIKMRKRKQAEELIRIRLTCMNPNKREWEGEIITAGNSLVGTHKKYIPFNADEGYHVPRIIYNQLLQRKCQVFYSVKHNRGDSTRKGKLIKEFAIELLPNLTPEEIKEIAQRQAIARSTD